MKERSDTQVTVLGAFFGFMSMVAIGSFTFAQGGFIDGIVQDIQQAIGDGITTVIDGITNLVASVIGVATSEIINVVQLLFGVVTEPLQGIVDALSSFFGSIASLPGELFGVTTFAQGGTIDSLSGELGLAILGIILIGVGVTIVTISDFPIIGELSDGVGSILVVLGAMIGIYGFFPEWNNWIIGGLFIVMFILVARVYVQIVNSRLKESTA